MQTLAAIILCLKLSAIFAQTTDSPLHQSTVRESEAQRNVVPEEGAHGPPTGLTVTNDLPALSASPSSQTPDPQHTSQTPSTTPGEVRVAPRTQEAEYETWSPVSTNTRRTFRTSTTERPTTEETHTVPEEDGESSGADGDDEDGQEDDTYMPKIFLDTSEKIPNGNGRQHTLLIGVASLLVGIILVGMVTFLIKKCQPKVQQRTYTLASVSPE